MTNKSDLIKEMIKSYKEILNNEYEYKQIFTRVEIEQIPIIVEALELLDAVVLCEDCRCREDCEQQITLCWRDYTIERDVFEYIKLGYCSFGQRKKVDD